MENTILSKVKQPKMRLPIVPGSKRKTKYYVQMPERGGQVTKNIFLSDPNRMIVGEECSLVFDIECTYDDGTTLPDTVEPFMSMPDILIETIELEVKGYRFNNQNGNISDHFLSHWMIPNYIRDGFGKAHYFLTTDRAVANLSTARATGSATTLWDFWSSADKTARLVRSLGDMPMFGTGDALISGLVPMNLHVKTTDYSLWQRALSGNADIAKPYAIKIKQMYFEIVTVQVVNELSSQITSEISQNDYNLDTFVNKIQVLNSGNVLAGSQTYEANVNLAKTPDYAYLLFLKESALQNDAAPYKQKFIFQATFDNISKVTITSGGSQVASYDDIKVDANKLKLMEDMSFSTNKSMFFKAGESVDGSVFVKDNVLSAIPIIFENAEEGFDPTKPCELRFEVIFDGGASETLRPMLLTRTKTNIKLGSGMNDIMFD